MQLYEIKMFLDENKEVYDALAECRRQKRAARRQLSRRLIDKSIVNKEIQLIEQKEANLKYQLVQEIHVTKAGRLRSIKYVNEYWVTYMPDDKRIRAKSKGLLYDKILEAYGLNISVFSIADVFDAAIEYKTQFGTTAFETQRRIRYDYKRFIDDEFASEDIRNVTNSMLRDYTSNLLHNNSVSVTAFKNYRIMLNTIFKYAIQEGIIIHNPVNAIPVREYSVLCYADDEYNKICIEEQRTLSFDEINQLKERLEWRIEYFPYYVYGYAMLFAIETGVRAGEIPALKWSDVYPTYIHIHAQQLCTREDGKRDYHFVPWTKNEKRKLIKTGRIFPMTDAIKNILDRLKAKQDELGIKSEYIFCNEDGSWIKSSNYERNVFKIFSKLGFKAHNNDMLRRSLNSNVFIPLGIPLTERARLLGHSVETNLRFYSYAGKDTNDEICELLNTVNSGVNNELR